MKLSLTRPDLFVSLQMVYVSLVMLSMSTPQLWDKLGWPLVWQERSTGEEDSWVSKGVHPHVMVLFLLAWTMTPPSFCKPGRRCRTMLCVAQQCNSKSWARQMAAAQLSQAIVRDCFWMASQLISDTNHYCLWGCFLLWFSIPLLDKRLKDQMNMLFGLMLFLSIV